MNRAPASTRKLYELTGGKAWEPPTPQSVFVTKLIRQGYLRRVDGRCGYERFKDSMLAWTEAGHAAMANATEPQP